LHTPWSFWMLSPPTLGDYATVFCFQQVHNCQSDARGTSCVNSLRWICGICQELERRWLFFETRGVTCKNKHLMRLYINDCI
jgi:hypothetical protein